MQKFVVLILMTASLGTGCVSSAIVPSVPTPVADVSKTGTTSTPPSPALAPVPAPAVSDLLWPISRAAERITKKMFGTYVTPKNSPVMPERFTGYHTGTDFETFAEEKDADVAISTICAGKMLQEGIASGYGGYAVQACKINGADVTVVYGHLRATSIKVKPGQVMTVGQTFAVLGTGYSKETDGERKHLHLDIHRGTAVNIRGYVSTKAALKDWIDFQTLMPK